jgi:hypothetical protein
MGQTESSEPVPEVDNETSVAGSVAWARSIGLGRWDRLCLRFAGYDGRALLTARKHELRGVGLSAQGAALLAHRLKPPVPVSKVFVDLSSDEDAEADFRPLVFTSQQDFQEHLLRSGASALRRAGVEDAPLCKAFSDLEEGCRYDFVFGKGSAWAKAQGGVKTCNDFVDRVAWIHERDAEASLMNVLVEQFGEGRVVQIVPGNCKTRLGSPPDGVFVVETDELKCVYLLEAQFNADNEFEKAEEQLDVYKEAAQEKDMFKGASYVKVLAHTGVTDTTRRKAEEKGIELIDLIGVDTA